MNLVIVEHGNISINREFISSAELVRMPDDEYCIKVFMSNGTKYSFASTITEDSIELYNALTIATQSKYSGAIVISHKYDIWHA